MSEVSLVDSPANPGVTFTMWKAADSIAKAHAERDDAVRKLAVVEGASIA